MIPIEPTEETLAELERLPGEGPVVMLNLLRFKPGGGAKQYARYAEAFKEILAELGGRILFAGRGELSVVGQEQWHHVTLVEYPSRRAFAAMFRSARYREAHAFREAGLEQTVLYALKQVTSTF